MMDFSLFKRSGLKLLPVLLALTASTGLLHASLLTVSPATATLTCNTASGTTPVTVTVKSVAAPGANGVVVTWALSASSGLVVTPSTQTLTTAGNTNGVTFSVTAAPGCVGVTNAAQPTVTFKSNGTADLATTVTTNVTVASDPLVASPSPVTVTCVYNSTAGTWTPGSAVTVSATSAATGGTPLSAVSLGTFGGNADTSLTLGSIAGSPATSTAATFTVQAAVGCGGYTTSSSGHTVIMAMGGVGPTKNLTVNIVILPQSPMQFSPAAPAFTYIKASGSAGYVDVAISSINASNSEFFQVNTTTLPNWLTASALNGTTPKSIRFSSTNVADTLAPGTYSASVHISVSNYGDLVVPVTMLLTNSAPKLTVAEGTTRNINWTIGQSLPTPVVTAVSSDTPIAYSVTTAGTLVPTVPAGQLSGLAYSFGTPINVSFNPLVFGAATPNSILTGTVTLSYGSPVSTIVVTFNITVISPGATASGLTPASIPTALPTPITTFTVTLGGTGFITGADNTKRTTVGIVAPNAVNNALTADTNVSWFVRDPSTIILSITVPAAADSLLPFSPTAVTPGGTVVIGVCNPINGVACTQATGQQTLTIGAGPIIQAVTSSSSLIQFSAPTLPSIAPYDMISLFGANFCSQGGTGCASNQILYGSPDPVLQTYPTTLTPDACNLVSNVCSPLQRNLSVSFFQHGTATLLGTAPLLFATNGQINALVPSGVSTKIGNTIDVVVNFGAKSSTAFVVNCVATDPGLFTIGADGQGPSAALDANYNLISASNPVGMRGGGGPSDTIAIYLTGLGLPDSTTDDSTAGSNNPPQWSTDCVSISTYLTALNSATGNSLATLDGALINPIGLNTDRLVPCLLSNGTDVPTVTIGGVSGTVTYAGWVAGTIAGLYQINVTLPLTTAAPFTDVNGNTVGATGLTNALQLPVVVTSNTVSSQFGVTLYVQQRLKVQPPAAAGNAALTGAVGNPWTSSNNQVIASLGQSPYRYTITSGLMPPGLSMSSSTGIISGTPNANTTGSYTLTVTATDSSVPVPLTGTVTFTLVINGGVYLTHSAPTAVIAGTANNAITTETPTTGVSPYTFSGVTAGTETESWLTVTSPGGVVKASTAAIAGTYTVAVTAHDSTAGTALVGVDSYPLTIALGVAPGSVSAVSHGNAGTITTFAVTGSAGGTPTFSLGGGAPSWVAIDPVTGVLTVTSSSTQTAGTSITINVTDGATAANSTAVATGTATFSLVIN